MGKMRTKKRNAFFVEIIIVILFFSLSVVVSLELFVQGHMKSLLSEQKNMALIRAQSAAELVQGYDPSGYEPLSERLEGSSGFSSEKGCCLYYDGEIRRPDRSRGCWARRPRHPDTTCRPASQSRCRRSSPR